MVFSIERYTFSKSSTCPGSPSTLSSRRVKPARKVAFVSAYWNGKIQQILRGALRFADIHPPVLVRGFGNDREGTSPGGLAEAVKALAAWNPEGVLATLDNPGMDQLLRAFETPPPVVNCMSIRPHPGVTEVVGAMPDLVAKAVEHFRQLGLRSLGFLTFDESGVIGDSLRSAIRSLLPARAADLDRMFLQAADPKNLLEAYAAPVTPVPEPVAAWLRGLPKPAGVLAIELGGGGYTIRVCKALGLRVPEDVAVIGGCDEADACLANDPTLTSIGVPGDSIGFEAMKVLDDIMAGNPARDRMLRVNGAELLVRQSTGQRRAEICDIAAAAEYIRNNACRGISVAEVVKATQGVSSMTFHKHFQTATGLTPGEAIRARQFEEARRLLAGTELSMSLVAEMSGFGSSNDFARAFRQRHGIPPTTYRQRERKPLP